jgi:hypothetical protein
LPVSEMREDFAEIVQDLEVRAKRFSDFNSKNILIDVVVYRAGVPLIKHQSNKEAVEASYGSNSSSNDASANENEDPSRFLGVDLAGNRIADGILIGQMYYPLGCLVKVHSKYSSEELHGVLYSISESELVCRCGSGVKFKVRLEHVVCGRLAVSQSEECYETVQVMQEAVNSQSLGSL